MEIGRVSPKLGPAGSNRGGGLGNTANSHTEGHLPDMSGLFDGTPLERPVTCANCGCALADCACPRNAAGDVTLPREQAIRIRREKRRGKPVTVIAGFDPVATDMRKLLATLKTQCAAGGTINGDAIEVQGDHRERALKLVSDLGYSAKLAGG